MIEVEVEVEIENGIRNSIPGVVLLSFQRISPLNLIQRLPSLLQSTSMHILFYHSSCALNISPLWQQMETAIRADGRSLLAR